MTKRKQTAKLRAKHVRKPKPKKENSNYCKDCGGKKSGYADDYFIKKCHCDELKIYEPDDDWDRY